MAHNRTITILVFVILIFALAATVAGIITNEGTGQYQYQSIRGTTVVIYGKGIYRHMSAEVAPQGIAQDYITLFGAIPLLLTSLVLTRRGSLAARYILSGTLAYFLVTYLFYTVMGMYNALFLVYVVLLGSSFYAFILSILSFDGNAVFNQSIGRVQVRLPGIFLIATSSAIALLWLSIVVPPVIDGSVIPLEVEHYTTLIVQGLDLAILLPAAFITGVLWLKQRSMGLLLGPVYLVFLSILMTALSAKIIAMLIHGYNVVPAIFIIPAFNVLAVLCAITVLRAIGVDKIKKNFYYDKAGIA